MLSLFLASREPGEEPSSDLTQGQLGAQPGKVQPELCAGSRGTPDPKSETSSRGTVHSHQVSGNALLGAGVGASGPGGLRLIL